MPPVEPPLKDSADERAARLKRFAGAAYRAPEAAAAVVKAAERGAYPAHEGYGCPTEVREGEPRVT